MDLQALAAFLRAGAFASRCCAPAGGRVVVIGLGVQGAGFDVRARRKPFEPAHLGLEGAHLSAHLKALCALVFEQSEQHLDRGGLLLEGEGRDRR